MQSDVWNLSPDLTTDITTIGASAKRRFPAVHFRACVSRRPGFVMLNVMLPTAVIALLSVTTFLVEIELTISKLDLSVTILLTAVAFKYATAAYLPQISYLTLIDKFVLLCMCMIVWATLLHALIGMLQVRGEPAGPSAAVDAGSARAVGSVGRWHSAGGSCGG